MSASVGLDGTPVPASPGPVIELPAVEEGTDLGAVAREFVTDTRTQLRAWHDAGAGGVAVVGEFTEAMDRLIGWLFDAAANRFRKRYVQLDESCAILAQGGYGRGELNPQSDIDLLVLYEHKLTPFVETVTETILYALWDTRMPIGHAVRTIKGCVQISTTDLTAKTALLDARFLCGDADLWTAFSKACDDEIAGRGGARFMRDKADESRQRHEAHGDSIYLLEPDLKEGKGGLRDLHTALWVAKVNFRARDFASLVPDGIASAEEVADIERARDFFFRVRNALHFKAGAHQDKLTFELQSVVAENLGYRQDDGAPLGPTERFMRDYYLHATEIHRFARAIIDRSVNPNSPSRLLGRIMGRTLRPGVRIEAGEVEVSNRTLFEDDPAELVRVVADAQRHDVGIAPATADRMRLEAHRIGEEQRHDPRVVELFLSILRGSYGVFASLESMHRLGILGRILPEWQRLHCLSLQDPYHVYTVDEHSLIAVHEIEKLRRGERVGELRLLTDVARQTERLDLLYLAMLMHDVGKGLGGEHSEKGAAVVVELARRMGLDSDDTSELEFLVRDHLVLSHAAQRRDMQDDKLVLELAQQIGSPETLKRLYVMTYADMRATAPKIWNNWKDMLLGEAYLRINEVFERGFGLPDRRDRVRHIQERVRRKVEEDQGSAAATRFASFCSEMPEAYFLRTPEHLIPRDAELVDRVRREGGVATRLTHYEDREFTGFTVAMQDQSGLFATVTGVLAAAGLDIVGARISTSRDKIALDSFRISHVEQRELVLDPERWKRIEATLDRVLSGEEELANILKRARRPSLLDVAKTPGKVMVRVGVDEDASDDYAIVDVFGPDRMGLLHDIACSFQDLGLDIHLAKVSTSLNQVLDVFYVTERDGTKPRRAGEIRATLIPILEGVGNSRDPGA